MNEESKRVTDNVAAKENILVSLGKWFANIPASIGNYFKSKVKGIKDFNKLDTKTQWLKTKAWFGNNLLNITMIILILIIIIKEPAFIGVDSIVNILDLTAAKLLLALGVAGTIVLAGTDLSAGKIMAITACVGGSIAQQAGYAAKMWPNLGEAPIVVILLVCIVIGALIGLFNGHITAHYKLHPFITTLGTQLILTGVIMWYVTLGNNNGMNISMMNADYTNFIKGTWISLGGVSIPYYVLYSIILTFVMWFIWNKTKFGKNMFAVGANEEAARVSGVNVAKTITLVFVLAGVYYGLGGFVEAVRVPSSGPATAVGFELDAISAAVIGGVSFVGGTGKIRGVVIGVLLLQIIFTGLIFLGIAPYWTYVVKGAIILFACALDMRKYMVKK